MFQIACFESSHSDCCSKLQRGVRPRPASPPLDPETMTVDTTTNGHYSGSSEPNRPVSSGYVVQKYGGTSVGKFAWKIVADVIKPSLAKDHVAVVCSAISAKVKADGTTNRCVLRSAFSE
jgi:hypothetical protein